MDGRKSPPRARSEAESVAVGGIWSVIGALQGGKTNDMNLPVDRNEATRSVRWKNNHLAIAPV